MLTSTIRLSNWTLIYNYVVSFTFSLRDRLVKIITDYRTETSLRHGCNDILKVHYFRLPFSLKTKITHNI